jgi:Na+-translocating ferredoxin:NAD+ oxidoreductase subunit G
MSNTPTDRRWPFRSALMLAAIGLSAALILAGLDQVTRDRISLEQERRALAALTQLLPEEEFDNELVNDWIELPVAGLASPARVYRARRDQLPVALIIDLVTARGYSGDIRLLVAVDPDGQVIGVRVLEHRETPGLGDRIEQRRSDWIEQFRGRSLLDPPTEDWAPDRRGGKFDTMTNATITASAVIDAVRQALEAVDRAEDRAWAQNR